jgi:hypothetical protein
MANHDKNCYVETVRGEVVPYRAGVTVGCVVKSVRSTYCINGGGLCRADGTPLEDVDILEPGVRYAFGGGMITCKYSALRPSREASGSCASPLTSIHYSCYKVLCLLCVSHRAYRADTGSSVVSAR